MDIVYGMGAVRMFSRGGADITFAYKLKFKPFDTFFIDRPRVFWREE
jgi:hypothetical protein